VNLVRKGERRGPKTWPEGTNRDSSSVSHMTPPESSSLATPKPGTFMYGPFQVCNLVRKCFCCLTINLVPGDQKGGFITAVIVVDFSILFQTFSVQLSTFSSFFIPLSSQESLKIRMNQQQTLMIVSFNKPTTTIYTRQDYLMGSLLASI
jgi:hypothetical protein